ncbi:MAG: bifunctional oligoribonuclease/PAP phosphatase NrnA [Lachnospiraceae bacterium]|nr:bifunctional oligoribonuclease/PAP phosphatase NrnA [Lachnospiraceae bacterium]
MIDLVKECEGASKIAIAGHVNPDGDCVGSVMALWQFLRKVYPQTRVDVMIEQPPAIFDFVSGVSEIVTDYKEDIVYDVMIVADTVPERCGEAVKYIETAKKVINIDHHISNQGGCDVDEIVPQASSAAEVVYELIAQKEDYKKLMDKEMAQTLYIGIIHDSGVMQYSNTSPKTLRIVAELIEFGFDFPKLIDETFYEKTAVQSKLLGKALMDAYTLMDGRVMVSMTDLKTMEEYGADKKDLSGIVNQLRIVKGVDVAVYIYEVGENLYKVSMRSCTDDIDVSKVSSHFGGGGHVRAAGCNIEGTYEEIIKSLTEQLALQMEDGR